MSIKPIIFSAPMVRALLAGTKTQTRRLLNPQPKTFPVDEDGTPCDVYCMHVEGEAVPRIAMGKGGSGFITLQKVPYAVGDKLYVREACAVDGARVWYRVDHDEAEAYGPRVDVRWRPSIHMPRSASRLWLTVTEVRVERLRDISGGDAVAEGIRARLPENGIAQQEYADLWNTLHTEPGTRWHDNPWVVAYTFTVHEGNVDAA